MVPVEVVDHVGQHEVRHVECAHEVDGNEVLVELVLDIDPVAVVGDTRIVHQDVDVRTERGDSLGDQILAAPVLAHVRLDDKGLDAILALKFDGEVIRELLGRVSTIVDDHVVAQFAQLVRHSDADAPGATRDDCHLRHENSPRSHVYVDMSRPATEHRRTGKW